MRNEDIFLKMLAKRFVRAGRITAVHPPKISGPPKKGRRQSCQALITFQFAPGLKHRTFGTRHLAFGTRHLAVALGLAFVLTALSAQAGVREVGVIGLTVGDLDHEVEFYTRVLPFDKAEETCTPRGAADELLGLHGSQLHSAELKLGDEHIVLTEHLVNKGRPIAGDSRSFDHWFQHLAIVVRDMDQAYQHLRSHHIKQISTGPQTLPAWNTNAAGIKAFYFRDPEDHALEIIFFPPGKGDPKWQRPGTNLFLGIDHTAIVVSDTGQSLEFYNGLLGLRVAGESENYGTEQEHLNQVFGARLRITGLRAEAGPGIELLEYLTPPGGRLLPPGARANDLIFWDTHLLVTGETGLVATLREHGVVFVSSTARSARSQIVRDPDGHALELEEVSPPLAGR